VDAHNASKLAELTQGTKVVTTFAPHLRVEPREARRLPLPADVRAANRIKANTRALGDKFPVTTLRVAPRAQVMMRCNAHADAGVVNGTMGIVTAVDDNIVSVRFAVAGAFKEVSVQRFDFTLKVGKTTNLVLTQFPLALAWATTIHKVQGLTLDYMRLDASNCFEPGQLYVALSRVRKLEHLSLLNFSPNSLLTNSRAVDFETSVNRPPLPKPDGKRQRRSP
jgi:ATP-dependent exoDNAse (exonuclease V) alpha subunit